MSDLADRPLWKYSAGELATGIRDRRVTSAEVVDAHLDRIRATNSTINALVDFDEQAVREAATAADRAVAAGEALGPLHGVPVSIKVNTDERGRATTNGLPAYADDVAPKDAAVTALVRASGAVLVGRNNVPQFSFRWFSENPLHGRTLNPWDETRTPGGSSGGAAAAVASGMVPLAHGNDIGGSIRYPAYACGVVGIRPTVGRVPSDFGWRDFDQPQSIADELMCVHGPIARTVDDLELGLRVMTGFDPRDGVSVPPRAEQARPVRRIGVVRDPGVLAPDPALAGALDEAAGYFSDAGIEVVELDLPDLAEAHRLWGLLLLEEMRGMRKLMDDFGDDTARSAMDRMIDHAVADWGVELSAKTYFEGWTTRNRILSRLGELFESTPVIMTPPSARPAFVHGTDTAGDRSTVEMHDAQWPQKALPVLGLPGVAVPTGVVSGVPTGVQLFGARFSDETLLDVARVVERRVGALTPVDPWGAPA